MGFDLMSLGLKTARQSPISNEFKMGEHCLLYFSNRTPKAIIVSLYATKNVRLNQLELYLLCVPKDANHSQSTVPTFLDQQIHIRRKTFLVVIVKYHKQRTVERNHDELLTLFSRMFLGLRHVPQLPSPPPQSFHKTNQDHHHHHHHHHPKRKQPEKHFTNNQGQPTIRVMVL